MMHVLMSTCWLAAFLDMQSTGSLVHPDIAFVRWTWLHLLTSFEVLQGHMFYVTELMPGGSLWSSLHLRDDESLRDVLSWYHK